MILRNTLVNELREYLCLERFQDPSLNGLQVEGRQEIQRIGCAVDSGIEVLRKGAERGVDFLIVHHGIFWKSAVPIVGPLRESLEILFASEMNLYASHLPLDWHPEVGNSRVLAGLLEIEFEKATCPYGGMPVGLVGSNPQQLPLTEFVRRCRSFVGAPRELLLCPFGPEIPNRVCVVSGAGADALYEFESESFDTIITGEPRQFAYHFCRDRRLNAIFAGHYATETLGVRALAEKLAAKHQLEVEFIDVPTGI